MGAELLETLVKLASLGASGISIFAIFWIGWLILRLPTDASPDRHKTLRLFMVACVAIAIISGATGLVNAKFKADTISELRHVVGKHEETIRKYETQQAEMRGVIESLQFVLESKEAAALEHGSPEIKRHVQTLKAAIATLTPKD